MTEEGMDKKELQNIKESLLKMRAELLEEVQEKS